MDYIANIVFDLTVAFVFLFIGVFIGLGVSPYPSTTYNNTQAVTDCATTLNRCMEGWKGTLDTLNSCNNLIN